MESQEDFLRDAVSVFRQQRSLCFSHQYRLRSPFCSVILGALLLVFSFPTYMHAQKQSAIRDLADGYRVQRRLFIRAKPSAKTDSMRFEYFEDREATDSYAATLVNGTTFVTHGRRGLVLMLGFLNPLQYSWSTSMETVDDPTYASVGKFLEALATFAGAGTGIGDVFGTGAGMNPGVQGGAMPLPATASEMPIEVRSPLLLQYFVWLYQTDIGACNSNAVVFNTFRSALVAADAALYAAPQDAKDATSRPSNAFSDIVKRAGVVLREPATMSKMRAAVDSSRHFQSRLVELNIRSRKTLDGIAGVADAYSSVLAASPIAFCNHFAPFTRSIVQSFTMESAKRLTEREGIVKTMTELNERVGMLMNRSEGDYFRVDEISVADSKIADVTLTVRRREPVHSAADPFTYEDRKSSLATFRVRPEQLLSMEFGIGVVALRDTEYPKFGTQESGGQTVVARAGADRQYTAPAALLSVVGAIPRAPVWPMLQIGVGTGESFPMLLFGAGLRFTSFAQEFSFSGGVVFPFVRSLNKLAIGDPVGGTAAINEDLTRTLGRRGFYLGIQRTLGGKP